ncbi:MAG: hypothetical protein AB3N23_22690 [Paracoccaceae bacterium]
MILSRLRPVALGLMVALPVHSASAQGTEPASSEIGFFDIFNFETIATSMMHTVMSTMRLFADIRYEQISFDPLAMRLTLLDLDVRPHLPGYAPDACTVTAARLSMAGQPLDRPDASRLRLAFDDVDVGMNCLPPEVRGMAFGIGLQEIKLPRLDLGIYYDYASGGAIMELSTDIQNVAALELFVDADYVSFRMDPDTEEPRLAVDLNAAHLTVDDRGAWALAGRILPPDVTNAEALQQIVAGAVAGVMSEANGLNTPQLSETQQRFTAEAGAVASGVASGNTRVVVATGIEGGALRIDEDTSRDFQALFDALNPTVSHHAPQLNAVVPVAELQAALNSEVLPENALELGRAMLTGVGTPRNVNRALNMLARASRGNDAEAAYLVADALAERDPETAYGHALRAAANNIPGALAVLDKAERGTSYEVMIELQNEATPGGPEPDLYNSALAMRQAARAYMNGTGRYRSYRAAYYWASMAAAAGDASGVAMRDEIEELMRVRGNANAWAEEIESLENGVLRDWIAQDIPARLQ